MASNTVDKSKLLENTELDKYILSFKRDVPNFYDDDICDVILVPVEGGAIKVFHHKPKNVRSQRPIVFIPGFGTATQSWRDFHFTHHGETEYYHIESREKISANIKRDKKADLSIDRLAKDIAAVIDFVGLTNSDYVLVGTCMAGGVLLYGAISQILQPPTMIAFDPFTKWTQNRFLVKYIMPILPPFFIGMLKNIVGKIMLSKMDNQEQIERNKEGIKQAVPWKWRKFSLTNVNYDLTNDFKEIKSDVFIFHGPEDKYHPDGTFRKVAERIPTSRFFYMKTSDSLRELLLGVIATEFANVTDKDFVPKNLRQFEIELKRELEPNHDLQKTTN